MVALPDAPRVGWVDEPDGRGTIGILFTCVSTLMVCSLSVIHLNVPSQHEGSLKKWAWHFYWCFLCIFGPELVIWSAWRQWLAARALQRDLAKTCDGFNMVHGFHAVMGDYVFDREGSFSESESPFVDDVTRIHLTPKGVRLIARCLHLPQISEADIKDRSKKDGLGKAIACLQGTYLIAQVTSRLALGLPITLLEVTTVGHVICAISLYMLWWHKPQKLEQPTILNGEWTRDLATFMCVASNINQTQRSILPGFKVDKTQPEICKARFHIEKPRRPPEFSPKPGQVECDQVSWRPDASLYKPNECNISDDCADGALSMAQADWKMDCVCRAIGRYQAVQDLLIDCVHPHQRGFVVAKARYPELPEEFVAARYKPRWLDMERSDPFPQGSKECLDQNLVTMHVPDWPHDGLLRTTGGLAMGAVLWIVSIVFSAVHVSAWNVSSPTSAESWLWRGSSAYVAFSGLFWAVLHILANHSAALWWKWYDYMSGQARGCQTPVTILCAIGGLLYIAARAFLVIEGFVELRSLPEAAFVAPQWTLSAPHVGKIVGMVGYARLTDIVMQ